MKKKIKTECFFNRCLYAMMILCLALLFSCKEKSQQANRNTGKIIPQRDFVSILSDLYLTDGLLIVQRVRDQFPHKDSIDVYVDVIKSHGYTKEDMDTTLKHYFLKKPKKLIKIYDKMLADFTEMDERLSANREEMGAEINNEWKGRAILYFPDSANVENPELGVPLKKHSYFSLTFTVTIYPYDETRNPGFTAWYVNADSVETGKKHFLPPVRYIKDGMPHTYNFNEVNLFDFPVILKGSLYDVENYPPEGQRSGKIEHIQLITSGGVI